MEIERGYRWYKVYWIIVAIVSLVWNGTGYSQSRPGNFRTYSLRYASASEVAPRIRSTLVNAGATQVLADDRANLVVVSGSEAVQSVAGQMLVAMDQPASSPNRASSEANEENVVRAYPVENSDIQATSRRLQRLFPSTSGTRIVADERTKQLIVIATPEIHAQIGRALEEKTAAPEETNAAPAEAGTSGYTLQYISWRDFEYELHRLWPEGLTISPSSNGDSSTIATSGPRPQAVMNVDRNLGRITFLGNGRTIGVWRAFVKAVDSPRDRADDVTQLISLENAEPAKVRTAVSLLNRGAQTSAKDHESVAVPLNGTGRGRTGGDLVGKIFQQTVQAQDAQPAPAPAPAPADQAPAAAGDQAALDAEGGGLIGPVQIEFLEGLDVVVIRGNKRDIARVQKIIEDIERLSEQTKPAIEVHQLQHANSEAVATLVTELYTEILSPRQGQVSIRPLVEPNAILLIGREESVAVVRALIDKLDQPSPPSSRFEVIRLKYVSAVDAERTVRNFFVTRPGYETNVRTGLGTRLQIIADFRTNSLIVQASPRDLEEVRRFIETIDVDDTPASAEIRVFQLKNAMAEDLASVLQAAISGQADAAGQQQQPTGQQQGGAASSSTANIPSTALEFMMIDQNGGRLLRSGILADVVVTADPSINALVVRAPTKSMELIAALIHQLDQLPDAAAQIKVFEIVNGDATSLAAMLQQLFGQQVTAGQGTAGGAFGGLLNQQVLQGTAGGESSLVPLRFAVDLRTNSIIASGSESDLQVVWTILTRLDQNLEDRKLSVVRLRNTQASAVATAIQTYLTNQQQRVQQQLLTNQAISPFEQIEREVFVVAEDITNSLIVSATPKFFDEIMGVIRDLDVRPPMVMVQVLIAEIVLDNTTEFGAEFGLQDSLVFDRGKAAGATAETVANPGFNFNTSPLPGYPNVRSYQQETLAGQSLTNFALGRTNSALGYSGLVLSAANESISVLLRALEDEGRVQILSRPQVVAMHNQPAFVQVGQDVARVTGTNINQNVVTQNIEDRQTGIILSILPLINEDGVIVLGIEAERSALGSLADGTPIGNGVIVPPVNVTRAHTTISAQSGQTVVLAGLITKNDEVNLRRVPYLADVPILGNLFQFRSDFQRRTELLIVMTPYMIRDEGDVEMMKLRESERMSWCLADVVNVAGDWGLQGSHCAFCPHESPLIFPDVDPTGLDHVVRPDPGYGNAEEPADPSNGSTGTLRPVPVSAEVEQPTDEPPQPILESERLEARQRLAPIKRTPGIQQSLPAPNAISPANYQAKGAIRLPTVTGSDKTTN